MLIIKKLILGPVQTNSYLLADSETKEAVVIDPAWDGNLIFATANNKDWQISQLWYTHAHFDHIGGAADLAGLLLPHPQIGLNSKDHFLWSKGGGGLLFGYKIDPGPEPTIDFGLVKQLKLGDISFNTLPTPGHTPGHTCFHCPGEQVLFSGDLIFQNGVGRTDLPGGDFSALIGSIKEQVFTLPDATRIFSGHGPETTVGQEKLTNPFF